MYDHTVLIIEADIASAEALADQLAADGYEPLVAHSTQHAETLAQHRAPALVVLGDLDGRRESLGLLRAIRMLTTPAAAIDPDVPVVVVSREATELDRLRAFDAGADDVMAQPVCYPELRARIGVLVRRTRPGAGRRLLGAGALRIDTLARAVTLHGTAVELSQKEYDLVCTLASQPARVFTKGELLRSLWGIADPHSTRTLDSHACRLRKKLHRDGDHFVVNVWGVGYRLVDGLAALDDQGAEAVAA